MEIFNFTERINVRYQEHQAGFSNYLPTPDIGAFHKWFPGFLRGDITCFTGLQACAKTSFSKYIVIHNGVEWAIKQKRNVRILYFGLEESTEEFLYSMLSYQLFKDKGLRYNIRDFNFMGGGIPLEHLEDIKGVQQRVEEKAKYVTYYDNVYNSFGIYKEIREHAREHGKFFHKGRELSSTDLVNKVEWDKYIPDDPEEIVVCVVDHVGDIEPQKDEVDQKLAIKNLVGKLKAHVAKQFGYSCVFVQHQDNSLQNFERRQAKDFLPSVPNLAITKEVGRVYKNIFGLTDLSTINPEQDWTWNVGKEQYPVRNLYGFQRVINPIKTRFGFSSGTQLLYFDGCPGYFEKMPPVNSQEYSQLKQKINSFL